MHARFSAGLGQLARMTGEVDIDLLHRELPSNISIAAFPVTLTETAAHFHLRSFDGSEPCATVLEAVAALHSHLCRSLP